MRCRPAGVAAGELVDLSVGQVGDADRLERVVDGRAVRVGQSPVARVREPAHGDGFADGDRHRAAAAGRLLGDVADPLAVVERGDRLAEEFDRAAVGTVQAEHEMQEVVFPDPLGPTSPRKSPSSTVSETSLTAGCSA